MKKTKKYTCDAVIVLILIIIAMLTLNFCKVQNNVVYGVVIVGVIIEFICIKVIAWLLKNYKKPTLVLLCTAITMFMIAILLILVWLTTYTFTDIGLTLAILFVFAGMTTCIGVFITSIIMNIKKGE